MTRWHHPPKKRPDSGHHENRLGTMIDVVLWWTVAATAAITPLVISVSGHDEFRAPKEYALRAGGILVFALLAIRFLYLPRSTRAALAHHRTALLAAGAVILWTVVSALFATNRSLSLWSLLYVAVAAAFFAGALLALSDRSIGAVYVLLAPAMVNTIILLLQVTDLWDPIYGGAEVRALSALVGSSNDVGAYLLAPAIIAVGLVLSSHERRPIHLAMALFLFAGILAARSATAIGAYLVAVATLGAILSVRRAVVLAGVILLVIAVAIVTPSPLRHRAVFVREAVISRDYNLLFSYRLTAFAAAWHMFRHHPLTGVGPGCYAWNYFDYKIAAEERYAILRQPGDHKLFMFGEAHSDHLQILAVSGLPGYLLFSGSLVLLGKRSWKRTRHDLSLKERIARLSSLPLAVGIATIALAQFPLELAASLATMLYATAICMSWGAVEDR